MQSLLDLFRKRLHWVVFFLLEATSLVLLFRFNPYQSSVWFTKATLLAGWTAEQEQNLTNYLNLGEENRRLTEQNLVLQRKLQHLRQELAQLRHDTTAAEQRLARQVATMRHIAARVSDNSVRERDNFLLINRGSEHGVKSGQGVVCGTGVVGIVAQTGSRYAMVIPILNSKSSISCRLRDSQYFGYLHWEGGNPLVAVMDDVPRHARLKLGMAVETSGFSNVFPEGLFLGRVIGIANSEDGMAYQLKVQLSTDFARLREVVVLDNLEEEQIREARNPLTGSEK